MKLAPEIQELAHTVTVESRLELAQVDSDLYVFERTTSLDAKGKKLARSHGLTIVGPQSGFVDGNNKDKLVKNQAFKTLDMAIWTPEQIELARTTGFVDAGEREYEHHASPLAQLAAREDMTADNIVRPDWSSHMLFDRHGTVLPVAIDFNYIESRIDESRFDLEALAEALLEVPDIVVRPGSGSGLSKTSKGYARGSNHIKRAKDAIFPIPYYNASEGRSKSVQFVWQPSKEDYAKVWAWAQENGGNYPSTRMRDGFFALDLYGLARFRRTPVDECVDE